MNRIWYLGLSGHPVGPLASDEVETHLRERRADGETLVWREGMAGWRTLAASELAPLLETTAPESVEDAEPAAELAPAPAAEPVAVTPTPVASATPLASVTSIRPTAEAAPNKSETGPERTRTPVAIRFGGFWRRAIALMIDGLLTTVLSAAITVFVALELGLYYSAVDTENAFHAVGQTMHAFSPFIAVFIYFFYFGAVQGLRGATFGKWLCGLRVTRPDGKAIGVPRALVRSFAWVFSGLAAGSGYLIAGVHPRKRSWHDIVSGTVVVKVPLEKSATSAADEVSSSDQFQTVRPAA